MFLRYFKNETARMLKSYKFYVIIAIFIVFVLTTAFYFTFSDENASTKTVYGISEYSSMEELNQKLNKSKQLLSKEKTSLENAISNDILSNQQIQSRQSKIDDLTRTVTAMEFLYDNNMDFSYVTQYNSFDKNNANCFLSNILIVLTLLLGFIKIISISASMVTEIKEGMAKLTLTLPITRVKYALSKFFTYYLQTLILLLACTFFALIISTLFFPADGAILFATQSYAFALTIIPAMFLQLCFSAITLFGFCAIVFSISLLINNKIAALLVSLLLCFCGTFISFLKSSSIPIPLLFDKYFISCNLNIEKCFIESSANNILLCLGVLFFYILLLLSIALIKFKRQDIKN